MRLYDRINNGDVYIIAEMSANHAGKIENAYKIIEEAAKAGADCVKIQTYTPDSLTVDCHSDAYKIKSGLWKGYNYYQLYQKAMTPWAWQDKLKLKCEDVGVDFLSTPFCVDSVDFLEGIGIEFYKIASFELIDIPLIEYIASKMKPIIMSVGMGSEDEIKEALDACKKYGNENVILLKCCSQYPANYKDMNIAAIPLLKEKFNKVVGLSDHSFGSLAPVIAVSMGAKIIEKHIKLDYGDESADSEFSMPISEFAQMVKNIRNTTTIIGRPTLELTDAEKNGLVGRRSLVACKEIKKGDEFSKENIKIIRPAIGIKPKYYNQLIGKKAKKSYDFGAPISEIEIGD